MHEVLLFVNLRLAPPDRLKEISGSFQHQYFCAECFVAFLNFLKLFFVRILVNIGQVLYQGTRAGLSLF